MGWKLLFERKQTKTQGTEKATILKTDFTVIILYILSYLYMIYRHVKSILSLLIKKVHSQNQCTQ